MLKKFGFLTFIGLLMLSAASVLADDGFYVVGGGGGVGTKITSLPYTISTPGFYLLSRNLSVTSDKEGITIAADNVTLDLMGFKLSGYNWGNIGIFLGGARTDVEIRNGTLTNWTTCITTAEVASVNVRVINVRVQAYTQGVYLMGKAHLIRGCEARNTIESFHLGSGTVSGCTVSGDINSKYGIYLEGSGIISNNFISDIPIENGGGIWGSQAATISGNTVVNCSTGIHAFGTISGNTITNCPKGIFGGGTIISNSVYDSGTYGIFAGGSLIGNTIKAFTNAVALSTLLDSTCLVTQNTVLGGAVYLGTSTINVAGTNAGF